MKMRVTFLALVALALGLSRSAGAALTDLTWSGCGGRQCATLAFCEIPGVGYGYR